MSDANGETAAPGEECRHGLAPGTCSICLQAERAPAARLARLRPTTRPTSSTDPVAELTGTKDISVPMYETEPYLDDRTDWLVAHGYPHDLRPHGRVYLRCDDRLAARVRAVRMAWREERPYRTGEVGTGSDFGPGMVFEVDPDTQEPFNQPLGQDAERMRQGYRYHLTASDRTVHHVMAGDRIPEGDWDG